jgi:DNA-directed RNA polymerase subunit RPC12/RpoP
MEPDSAATRKIVPCPSCGNRLRLWSDQAGSQVVCPKCSSTFTVARTSEVRAAARAAGTELDEYEPEIPLARSSSVPEDEMVDIGPNAGAKWQQIDWESDADPNKPPPVPHADYLAAAKAQGLLREPQPVYRPRSTFFSDVFTFPWKGVNIARWTGMAVGFSATAYLFVQTAEMLGLWNKSAPAMGGIFLIVFTVVAGVATGSLAAASFVAAIQDTADGYREPQESNMPEWNGWIFLLFGFLAIGVASAAIGFPLSFIEPIGVTAILVSGLIVFPVLVLSAMEVDSFFAPYSRAIARTIPRCWDIWLTFYFLSTAMLALWAVPFIAYVRESPALAALLSGPVLAAMMLIYARMLGRVAWYASGRPLTTLEGGSIADGKSSAARPDSNRRKKRGLRLEFPGEADALANLDIAPPAGDATQLR